MLYTVYKTTNTVNGKIYIGVHKTEDPNDGYLGSGEALSHALRKYGRQAFKKEVLHVFDNPEDMRSKERELVNDSFVKRADTYNLMRGGDKGFGSLNSEEARFLSRKGHEAQRRLSEEDPVWAENKRKRILEGIVGRPVNRELLSRTCTRTWTGRKHTEETRRKMSESSREPSLGERNSQWGTVWICKNGEKPRKVKKIEVSSWERLGWNRGRRGGPGEPLFG